MAETESYQLNIGVLRSQMTLQIHTRQAARLWYGRKLSEDKPGILGLNGFLAITNRINIGSRQDDPYSDWWMLRIEEKIDETKEALNKLKTEVDQVFFSVPATFTLTENVNIQPATLPIFAGSHMGYLAIYVLALYDEIVRKVMLALHIALISRVQVDHWLEQGDHYMRSLFGLAQLYRYSGITRKDIAEGNAAVRAALEKFGQLPEGILEGKLRSRFSPPLHEESEDISEDSVVDEQDEEQTLTLVVPTESELEELETMQSAELEDLHNTSVEASEESDT